jgi:2',3'-cyclic-nucleotide 2'-phosphodiesterase (5'-nucleotidase family)
MNKYTTELVFQGSWTGPSKRLNIIHFNDVYNIESRDVEPVGGSARFITAIEDLIEQNPNTLVLFSGDAISPSSSILFVLNISIYLVLINLSKQGLTLSKIVD